MTQLAEQRHWESLKAPEMSPEGQTTAGSQTKMPLDTPVTTKSHPSVDGATTAPHSMQQQSPGLGQVDMDTKMWVS